jgi:N-acetylneuraminic acid mutarotase
LIDGNGSLEQALSAGSVIARKPGEAPPPGYTLFQRNEYNATLVWEEKAPVSVGRYTGDGLVEIDGKIYFVGGYNTSGALKTFECYDPQINQWETLPDLQDAREGLASAVLDGKIYAIGGVGFTSMEIFDPHTNQWSYGASLPKEIDRACAVSLDGKIILTGGRLGGVDLLDVYEFDPERGTWEGLTSMNHARSGHRMLIHDGRAWVLGGGSTVCESYDPGTNSWQSEASLNTARTWPVAWTNGEDLFVAEGGSNTATTAELRTIEILSKGSSQWEVSQDSLPGQMYGADTIVSDEMLFLISGKFWGNFTRNVYAADLPAPAMNLYFKEGNATAEAELSTLGMADGSVTLGQLAPDALAKMGLDHNPATAEG